MDVVESLIGKVCVVNKGSTICYTDIIFCFVKYMMVILKTRIRCFLLLDTTLYFDYVGIYSVHFPHVEFGFLVA